MALKPTIYKFRIALSDLDRDYHDSLNLTAALHPSEKIERLMVRVLAFCLNAEQGLTFSKGGLSEPDDPDLLSHTPVGKRRRWVAAGEPGTDRLQKGCRLSSAPSVYSFNPQTAAWWTHNQAKLATLPLSVYQFAWPEIQNLAAMASRVTDMAVTISGDSLHVATNSEELGLTVRQLQ